MVFNRNLFNKLALVLSVVYIFAFFSKKVNFVFTTFVQILQSSESNPQNLLNPRATLSGTCVRFTRPLLVIRYSIDRLYLSKIPTLNPTKIPASY